jgi:fructose-1,6-bisphosphatase I
MSHKPVSLTEFVLDEQRKYPKASGDFTLLLIQLAAAGKTIASHIRRGGLGDMFGKTGKKNTSNDEVIALDEYSNDVLVETLTASGQVHAVASEEMDEIHHVTKHTGEYIVFLDPLDGSSNTAYSITVGTIFSIYHKKSSMLARGIEQVAAGYILYGTSVMFVYTSGGEVNGFTLDPAIGEFLLSHPSITIPKTGSIYAINEGNALQWDTPTQEFMAYVKKQSFSARYVGSLVADIHRTLLKGGIFLYPADTKHPHGKLRLLFEVNPIAFLIQQAGGVALCGMDDPLAIVPSSLHQRVPVVLGSKEEVEYYRSLL